MVVRLGRKCRLQSRSSKPTTAISQALLTHKADFEKLTGITLKVDGYQEQQMRQRLVTVMNAHSDEVDVFMTLPSREGAQFAAAGWYADLTPMTKNEVAPDYDTAGLSQALLKAATYDSKLTSIPMNIEGPVLYYRTDIFKKCGVDQPKTIADGRGQQPRVQHNAAHHHRWCGLPAGDDARLPGAL